MDRGVISWTPLRGSEKLRPPPVGRYLRVRAAFRVSSARGPICRLSIACKLSSAAKQRSLELSAHDHAREVWDFHVASPGADANMYAFPDPLVIYRPMRKSIF